MALRATRQNVEVLAAGDGSLRVTRQNIEVLSSASTIFNESANNTLSFTQNLNESVEWNRNASNTLNLAQNLFRGTQSTVNNILNFTSIATYFLAAGGVQSLQHTLNLQQQNTWETLFFHVIEHDLGLSQQVDFSAPIYENIQTTFYFQQSAQGYTGRAESVLQFVQTAGLNYELSVNNVITFVQEGERITAGEGTLNLSQTVVVGKSKDVLTTLNLTSVQNYIGIFFRSLSHSSILGHALTYYIEDACNKKSYTPFIGDSTIPNSPAPPDTNLPYQQNDPSTQVGGCAPDRLTLVYPAYGAPIDTVLLRAPELDNRDRVSSNRINRETRGGYLTVFADPNWPQVQTLIVNFVGLSETEINNIQNFFVNYIGKEINLTDWEGREWIGIITTPNEAAVQDGDYNWSITFEFEGTLIGSHTPDTGLQLTQAVGYSVV